MFKKIALSGALIAALGISGFLFAGANCTKTSAACSSKKAETTAKTVQAAKCTPEQMAKCTPEEAAKCVTKCTAKTGSTTTEAKNCPNTTKTTTETKTDVSLVSTAKADVPKAEK